jgi:cysteine desulfurase
MDRPIYLDHNATTPVAAPVLAAMLPFLEREFGNPSSGHPYGARAHEAVERARAQVADLLGCGPDSVVFTASGSEANNLAIKGVTLSRLVRRGSDGRGLRDAHIITTAIEHPAVVRACRYLEERLGCRLTVAPVDGTGLVDPGDIRRAIEQDTVLITVMHANNEVGTVQPIEQIAALAMERGITFHTDAAQSVGKLPTMVDELGVDLLSVAGHKLYAPKGIGALYVRPGTVLDPLIHGAGHEHGRRAGTENVPYIVALGAACELAGERLRAGATDAVRQLRNRLHAALRSACPELILNGHPDRRPPNTLNVSLPGVDGEELLARTPSVAASTGSACHSGRTDPRAVLSAMGIDRLRALGPVRLSLGFDTSEADVDKAAAALAAGAAAVAAPA